MRSADLTQRAVRSEMHAGMNRISKRVKQSRKALAAQGLESPREIRESSRRVSVDAYLDHCKNGYEAPAEYDRA